MKKIIIGLLALSSFSAFAETIVLASGESIRINGDIVKCEGSRQSQGNASYAELPWSKLQILLEAGLGSCKIKYTQGSNPQPFYYSIRFNGVHVNSQTYGIIRNDIRSGSCD